MRTKLALITCLLGIVAACAGGQEQRAAYSGASQPIQLGGSAFDAANSLQLADVEPQDLPGLHHVYRLSEQIISGAEPQGEAAFAQLEAMGVRTVLSVDGKIPNRELAATHGLRYVHLPIQYSGITGDELMKLSKTFRELEGPFYVHCFHGKHRGPAAAAIGRVVRDGAPRDQAIAEMRQWCSTSSKYEGLYKVVATAQMPSPESTNALEYDFSPAHTFTGVRGGMIGIARKWDLVKEARERNWQDDPQHPDVSALQEATQLHQIYADLCRLDELNEKPSDFRDWMHQGRDASARLVRALSDCNQQPEAEGVASWHAEALAASKLIGDSCSSCHAEYRN